MVQSVVSDSDGWESAARRLSEFVEDLRRAMSFMAGRSGDSILRLESGRCVDRWGLNVRLSERARHDAHFRRELLRHPRYVSAIAVQEGLGIDPLAYLWQIKVVTIVEEEPGLHWLILPACHRGCELRGAATSPATPTGSCHVCGKPFEQAGDCQRGSLPPEPPENRLREVDELIHDVDEFIVRLVQANVSSRARLMADPTGFFAEACRERLGVCSQDGLGIRELRVAADTDTLLNLVLLAKHSPNTPQ